MEAVSTDEETQERIINAYLEMRYVVGAACVTTVAVLLLWMLLFVVVNAVGAV